MDGPCNKSSSQQINSIGHFEHSEKSTHLYKISLRKIGIEMTNKKNNNPQSIK